MVSQRSGLGVQTEPPPDPFGIRRQRQRQNRVPGEQWFSPIAFYLGPYDDRLGLEGSLEFFRRTGLYGNPPQVYLTATESGLGIIPIQNWLMRKARGRAKTLWTRYEDIREIELQPASKARKSVMRPATAHQLGAVTIRTTTGRTGALSGTTVAGLSKLLVTLGAEIQT